MFQPLPVFVGLRYTRARRRNHFISFTSATAILGIILGVVVLIAVLSVMNGFERELRDRILGVAAHATVFDTAGPVTDWRALSERLRQRPHVAGAAPFIRAAAMVANDLRVNGVVIHGILPEIEDQVSIVGGRMREGRLADLKPGGAGIVIGRALAGKLGVGTGDRITLIAPQPSGGPDGVTPELRRFTVAGLFDVGMYEYDSSLAMMHLADAAELFRTDGAASGIRLRYDDAWAAPALSRELVVALDAASGRGPGAAGYAAIDWTQFYVNFFKALKSQKTMMFVIVMLIVAVAAFNIVSTLVMVVNEKRADIAVLRTLGLSPARVMAVFVVHGLVIGAAGTLAGGLAGVWLAGHVPSIAGFLERRLGIQLLPADVYFLSELPVDIHAGDVIAVCGMAFGLCLLATIYPAWRAARMPPAEALRYE